MIAPLPSHEPQRLQVLRAYGIMDTPAEAEFDELTALASQICGTPIAAITLVDEGRQWFKSQLGLAMDETSRDVAFCAHALEGVELLMVPDALLDPRFADNALVTGDLNIRFYAGTPLISSGGLALGTLCVIDRVPRQLTEAQQFALRVLGRQVMTQIQLRHDVKELKRAESALIGMVAEQADAENALRQSESEQRQLAEELTAAQAVGRVGSWETELATMKVTWSAQTHRIFETDPETFEVTHQRFLEFVHPEDRVALDAAFGRSLGIAAPCSIQHRIVLSDGRVKHIEERWQSFPGDERHSARAIGTCQDITERKLAEEERDRLFTLSLDLLCVANFEGEFLQLNPAWTKTLGWTVEELKAGTMHDFIHPDDHEATRRNRAKIIQGNPVWGFENRYRCKDGSYRWLSWNVHPLEGVQQVFGMARDVTERRLIEQVLAVSEAAQRLAAETQTAIQNALPAHIALIDQEGVIVSVNESWRRFAIANPLQTEDFFVGHNYIGVCEAAVGECSEDAHRAAGGLRAVLSGEISTFEFEYPCHSATEKRWFRMMVTPLREDRQAGAVVMHVNVTERKLAEEKAHRLTKLYAVSSEINEAIVRTSDSQELYEHACRIAVERGGLVMAWVGLAAEGEDVIKPVTHWGRNDGYLDSFAISIKADDLTGRGPGGQAFRSGTAACCNDIEADVGTFASKAPALLRGYRSCAVFPIHVEGRTVGILAVYGDQSGYFGIEEMELLKTLAENLSFAVESYQREQYRVRAESALRESEQRFRQLAENIHEVFWMTDPTTNQLLYIGPAYEEIWGRSCAGLYENPGGWLESIHPDDRERVKQAGSGLQAGGEYDETYRVIRPDGEIRWIHDRAYPVRDEKDQLYRIVGTAEDVTRRKRTELALNASEERYRKLFEQNPHPMWLYDTATLEFLAVNDTAVTDYGYSREEFLSMTIIDIRPPEDVGLLAERMISLGDKVSGASILRHRLKNGAIIQAEVSSHPLEFAGREARMVLAQNVTERLIAEKQIREQATLLDKAQDAILVLDLNHRLVYWNRSAERLYGWTAAEALGTSVEIILYRDPTEFGVAMKETLDKGEWLGEIEQVTKAGKTLIVEGRWTLVRDEHGEPKSILSINTDITERKKLEQQFLRAQRMESIGTLAGGIAHDLNNVLAPIMMSIDLLKMSMPEPRALEILNMIGSSAQRGADMVSQVLSFARGMEGRRIKVEIKHLISDMVKIVEDTFPKSIRIEATGDAGLWIVEADPTQLHQVLLNLCVNSRDAMPEGGRITILASNRFIDAQYAAMNIEAHVGHYVCIDLEDTGTGMPRELVESIFDPFFTTKEVGKGTGLGLSTALAIVEGHGGFIQVYSDLGMGSRFRIYLPAVDEVAPEFALDTEQNLPRGNGETILVVDDEASIRQITQQTLEAFGYSVLVASDGAEAVSVFVEHRDRIDVVLTDMMMPIMDGPSLIKVLRRLEPGIRIIGASGIAANGMVAQSMQAGVKQFLPKPYSSEILLKSLKKILTEIPA